MIRKILILIVVLVALIAGTAILFKADRPTAPDNGENATTTPVIPDDGRVRAPEEITLGVGENATINDITFTLESILEDSRCPQGVECIQAGRMRVRMSAQKGDNREQFELSSDRGIRKYEFESYVISIVSVAPDRVRETPTDQDYRITFQVSPRALEGGDITNI